MTRVDKRGSIRTEAYESLQGDQDADSVSFFLYGTGAPYRRVSDANGRAGGISVARPNTAKRLCVGERPVLKLSITVQVLGR